MSTAAALYELSAKVLKSLNEQICKDPEFLEAGDKDHTLLSQGLQGRLNLIAVLDDPTAWDHDDLIYAISSAWDICSTY